MYEVSVGEYSATLNSYGAAKLLNEDGEWRGDVFWFGREMAIGNGAFSNDPQHNNPIRNLIGELRINGVSHGDIAVYDAAMHYVPLRVPTELRLDPRDSWFLDWQLSNGPEEINTPEWYSPTRWGPNPDLKDPGQTGSPRMVTGRDETVTALMQETNSFALVDSQRWVSDQLKRCVHYYDWAEEHESLPGVPRQFIATSHPNARVGKGYRSPGGFSSTYSGTEFFGREGWNSKQHPYPNDHMHFECHKLVAIAILTKSVFAAWTAVAEIEANHSRLVPSRSYSSPRSQGWCCEAYTMVTRLARDYWPATEFRLSGYLDTLLDVCEEHNIEHVETGLTFSCHDRATSGKTGHMEMTTATEGALDTLFGGSVTRHVVRGLENIIAHRHWLRDNVNAAPLASPYVQEWEVSTTNGELARGWCVWMGGIYISGLDKVMMWGNAGQVLRAGRQMDLCASIMARACVPSLWASQHTLGAASDVAWYGVLDDVSGLGLSRPATGSPAGVARSFLLPGLEVLIRRYELKPGSPIVDCVERIISAMQEANYWGSSGSLDRGLTAFRMGAGWESHGRGAV
jgi:hypothetical protein